MGDRPLPEPLSDFGVDDVRRRMAYAIADNAENLGLDHPLWISGKRVTLPATVETRDPSDPRQVVSIFPSAGPDQVAQAVESAVRGQAALRTAGGGERARVLRAAVESLRPRRFELCSWSCFEAGSTWREADADFAAALDALLRGAALAEEGHTARGPIALAAGDGGPLGTLAGPLAAHLAGASAVVVWAAPQAPLVQWRFLEALLDAGLPPEALQFLVGPEAVGPLAFDGHLATAVRCEEDSLPPALRAAWRPALPLRDKLIVVLEAADPQVAARHVVASACACAGRHPAGGGRVLALGRAHDALVERICAEAREREVGPAIDFSTAIGPLPDAERHLAWREAVVSAGAPARLRADVPDDAQARRSGFFAAPHVWAGLAPDDPLWTALPPGPAVVVARSADLDEAIAVQAGLGARRLVLHGATPAEAARLRTSERNAPSIFVTDGAGLRLE